MQKCVIIANCQGEILSKTLKKHIEFNNNWEIEYFANFMEPQIANSTLESCDLLIYQQLGESFGDLSEASLLAKIGSHTKTLVLPNLMNFHLWPTAKWNIEYGPIWIDTYFDEIISRELGLEESVYVIMKTDFAKIFDLEQMMKKSLQREFEKNYPWRKEILSFIEENWKKYQIFTTPSHPANDLIEFLANLIFNELGYKKLKFDKNYALLCDRGYFLPIHPFFIKYYNLKWINADTKFPVFNNTLTYLEYVSTYVKAKKNKVPIFYAFNIWEKKE